MAKHFDSIPDYIIAWILTQKLFWVATAPAQGGHINVSPKSVPGTFHVVNNNRVWYEDLTGSGAETISHLKENGRITVMFHAFDGPPQIVRLWGTGKVHEFGTPEYEALIPDEARKPGSRSVIVIDVHKVGTSCGYAIPLYEFKSHRTKLLDWAGKREQDNINSLQQYWAQNNVRSLDGLEGMTIGPTSEKRTSSRPEAGRIGVAVGDLVSTPGDVEAIKESKLPGPIRQEAKTILAFVAGVLSAGLYFKVAYA